LPLVAAPPDSLDAVLDAAEHAAAHWGLSDPVVVRIGINGVFACDDVILRVSQPTAPASAAIELAHLLIDSGVRVPAPWIGDAWEAAPGLWVTAWERIHHDATRTVDWRAVGAMVRVVHGIDPGNVPHVHPLPWCAGFPWWHFDHLIETASDLVDDAALAGIGRCVSENRWVLDASQCAQPVVCHGDVHPGNVLVDGQGPVLIDWDLLCWGPAGWDHAPLMTWTDRWDGRSGMYEEFAAGYGLDGHQDPAAVALSYLRLVAATFGRVHAARSDPAAAIELERRLQWWRGDPSAPPWNPQ
jgi:aminoglycoside phosphotransferase (APT) family kinase protein